MFIHPSNPPPNSYGNVFEDKVFEEVIKVKGNDVNAGPSSNTVDVLIRKRDMRAHLLPVYTKDVM